MDNIEIIKYLIDKRLIIQNEPLRLSCWFSRKCPDNILKEIISKTNFLKPNSTNKSRIYCLYNNISEAPICKRCGNKTNYQNTTREFSAFCSTECLDKSEEKAEWAKQKINVEKLQGGKIQKNGSLKLTNETKNKIKRTNLRKYGHENPMLNKNIKEKHKQSLKNTDYSKIKNTGKDHWARKRLEHLDNTLYNKEWCYNQHKNLKKSCILISKELGVSHSHVNNIISKTHNIKIDRNIISSEVHNICNLLKENNIQYVLNDRNIISPYELDIYLPEYKLAIEFNGDFWHCDMNKKNDYHKNKTKLCEENGIKLLHIFEYDWTNKLKIITSMILNKVNKSKRIYARKCEIKEVSKKEERIFLNDNHLQGFVGSKVCYGLYYNNELVSLMSFGVPRFNKNYEWELLRFCNKLNTTVVGGASKLFKHFVKNNNVNEIISYSNKKYSFGDLYKILDFNYKNTTKPNYIYVGKRDKNIIYTRYQAQKHKLKNFLPNFDPNLTEYENMVNNDFLRIYDCGNDVFVWNNL